MVIFPSGLQVPVVDPDLEPVFPGPRQLHGPPLGLFTEGKGLVARVGDGQVGKVNSVGPPRRPGFGIALFQAHSEKGELVPEGLPGRGFEGPGVLPPLRLEFRVRAEVPGETEVAPGPGGLEISGTGYGCPCQ